MISNPDSGDTVQHKDSSDVWTVACVIHGQVYKIGQDSIHDDLDKFRLINKASSSFRDWILNNMLNLPDGDVRKNHVENLISMTDNEYKSAPVMKAIRTIMMSTPKYEDKPNYSRFDDEFIQEHIGVCKRMDSKEYKEFLEGTWEVDMDSNGKEHGHGK